MDANESNPTMTGAAAADPLRASLRAIWTSAAPSWGEHAGYLDDRAVVVTQAMIDAVDLHRGERVLELACGPGGVGIAAADVVGANGSVVLSDFAPEMTAIAAERAMAAGLTNVTTREVDLERIDYPDAAFDVVLCREGLMLVVDPTTAVRETQRVLRPTGRAVFTVWGPRERNPWLGLLLDAVTDELGVPVPPPGVPGPFSLEAPGALAELLVAGGFTNISVREIPTPMHVSSIDQWWSVVPSLAGPVATLLASLPAQQNAAIRAHAENALADFVTPTGYEIPGVNTLCVGHSGSSTSPLARRP
jgi:SAM-dependent methyltransferase